MGVARWANGWDHLATADLPFVGAVVGSPAIDTATPRTGSGCLSMPAGSQLDIAAQTGSDVQYGFAIRMTDVTVSSAAVGGVWNTTGAGSQRHRVAIGGSVLNLYDSANVLVASDVTTLANNTWYHVEVWVSQVGDYRIYLNERLVLSGSSATVDNGGVGSLRFEGPATGTMLTDDLYFSDGGVLDTAAGVIGLCVGGEQIRTFL